MVTKGIIKSIDLLGNTCTVHIPFFETAGNDPIIETATVSNTPGSYNGYKVGDVVYVAFEDGDMSNPVIVGKLYLGVEKEKADPRGVINVEESSAAKKATLPADAKLAAKIDSSVPNTTVPYSSLSSIANGLNTLNTNVGQMDRDYGNRFKQVITNAEGLKSEITQTAASIRADVVHKKQDGTQEGLGWDLTTESWKINAQDTVNDEVKDINIVTIDRSGMSIAGDLKLDGYPKNIIVRYAQNDSDTASPKLDSNEWSIDVPERVDGKYIWQWTHTETYLFDKASNSWKEEDDDKVVCITGATGSTGTSATTYWAKLSTAVHKGKNQDSDIEIIPYAKIGGSPEAVDTTAYFKYSLNNGTTWNNADWLSITTVQNNKIIISAGSVGANDIIIKLAHAYTDPNDSTNIIYTEYETETITYSPLNTPIIDLDNDTDVIKYKPDGTKITTNVSSTAQVYLGGSAEAASYEWECTEGIATFTGGSTQTITVTGISSDKAILTCTATTTNFKDEAGNTVKISKDFIVSKEVVVASYWLSFSPVHTGTSQQNDIEIRALAKLGNDAEDADSAAYLRYSWDNGLNWSSWEKPTNATLVVTSANIQNSNLRIQATHNQSGTPYEDETITYSPLNTPVLDLSNDSASITYDGNTKLGNGSVSCTATLYLNGEPLNSEVLWFPVSCTATQAKSAKWSEISNPHTKTAVNSPTVTISTLQANIATATCWAFEKLYEVDLFVYRSSFTESSWATYGTLGHTESWTNAAPVSVGNYFVVIGKSTDKNKAHVLWYQSQSSESDIAYGVCVAHKVFYEKDFTIAKQLKGQTGDQGISIKSQTTYYALVSSNFDVGDIAAPTSTWNNDREIWEDNLEVKDSNNESLVVNTDTLGPWVLTPPKHTDLTIQGSWKYWTTVKTEYSEGKPDFSAPIINEDLNGVYALAQGKSTNYYSDVDPSNTYSVKKGDCWFDTGYVQIDNPTTKTGYLGKFIVSDAGDIPVKLDETDSTRTRYIPDASGTATTHLIKITPDNINEISITVGTDDPTIAYETGNLKQWDGSEWQDIAGELVTNKLTANYINALDITARKITVRQNNTDDESAVLFEADGLSGNGAVTVGGFTVDDKSLSAGRWFDVTDITEQYAVYGNGSDQTVYTDKENLSGEDKYIDEDSKFYDPSKWPGLADKNNFANEDDYNYLCTRPLIITTLTTLEDGRPNGTLLCYKTTEAWTVLGETKSYDVWTRYNINRDTGEWVEELATELYLTNNIVNDNAFIYKPAVYVGTDKIRLADEGDIFSVQDGRIFANAGTIGGFNITPSELATRTDLGSPNLILYNRGSTASEQVNFFSSTGESGKTPLFTYQSSGGGIALVDGKGNWENFQAIQFSETDLTPSTNAADVYWAWLQVNRSISDTFTIYLSHYGDNGEDPSAPDYLMAFNPIYCTEPADIFGEEGLEDKIVDESFNKTAGEFKQWAGALVNDSGILIKDTTGRAITIRDRTTTINDGQYKDRCTKITYTGLYKPDEYLMFIPFAFVVRNKESSELDSYSSGAKVGNSIATIYIPDSGYDAEKAVEIGEKFKVSTTGQLVTTDPILGGTVSIPEKATIGAFEISDTFTNNALTLNHQGIRLMRDAKLRFMGQDDKQSKLILESAQKEKDSNDAVIDTALNSLSSNYSPLAVGYNINKANMNGSLAAITFDATSDTTVKMSATAEIEGLIESANSRDIMIYVTPTITGGSQEVPEADDAAAFIVSVVIHYSHLVTKGSAYTETYAHTDDGTVAGTLLRPGLGGTITTVETGTKLCRAIIPKGTPTGKTITTSVSLPGGYTFTGAYINASNKYTGDVNGNTRTVTLSNIAQMEYKQTPAGSITLTADTTIIGNITAAGARASDGTSATSAINKLTLGSTATNISGALDIYGTGSSPVFSVTNDGTTTIAGDITAANRKVYADSFYASSDRRLKQNISALAEKQAQYNLLFDGLNPVEFRFKADPEKRLHLGFIAQETDAAAKKLDANLALVDTHNADRYSLNYLEIIALNTLQIKQLKAQIAELTKQLAEQTKTKS